MGAALACRSDDAGVASEICSHEEGKEARPPSPATTISRPWLPRVPLGAPAPPHRILAAPLPAAVRHEGRVDGGAIALRSTEKERSDEHSAYPMVQARCVPPRNARKVKADVTALAMSLAADGLIQNITVAPREDGKFEIIAGKRRRRAIVQLVRARTWERDIEILCGVQDSGSGTGVIYAQNSQRVAMHPADAIRALTN